MQQGAQAAAGGGEPEQDALSHPLQWSKVCMDHPCPWHHHQPRKQAAFEIQHRHTHLPLEVTWAAGRAAAVAAIEAAVAGCAAAAVEAVKVRVRTAACAIARHLAAMAAVWAAEAAWRKGWAEEAEAEAAAAAAAVAAAARPAPLQRTARLAHAFSMAFADEGI